MLKFIFYLIWNYFCGGMTQNLTSFFSSWVIKPLVLIISFIPGSLNSGTTCRWSRVIPCCGGVLYIVGGLAPPLTSTKFQYHFLSFDTINVSRYSQVPPGKQNHPQLRITENPQWFEIPLLPYSQFLYIIHTWLYLGTSQWSDVCSWTIWTNSSLL